MNKERIAYLAGIFDGEGCIYGQVYRHEYGGFGNVRVQIGMAYPPVLDEFREQFGGQLHKDRPRSLTHKTSYSWCLNTSKDVLSFLVTIRPYLREKASQADLAIDYLRERLKHPKNNGVPEYVRQLSFEVCRALKDEKRKSFEDYPC